MKSYILSSFVSFLLLVVCQVQTLSSLHIFRRRPQYSSLPEEERRRLELVKIPVFVNFWLFRCRIQLKTEYHYTVYRTPYTGYQTQRKDTIINISSAVRICDPIVRANQISRRLTPCAREGSRIVASVRSSF